MHTYRFIASKTRQLTPIIETAEMMGQGCDFDLGVKLNVLRGMFMARSAQEGERFAEKIPPLNFQRGEGYTVLAAEARRLHDQLLAVIDTRRPSA